MFDYCYSDCCYTVGAGLQVLLDVRCQTCCFTECHNAACIYTLPCCNALQASPSHICSSSCQSLPCIALLIESCVHHHNQPSLYKRVTVDVPTCAYRHSAGTPCRIAAGVARRSSALHLPADQEALLCSTSTIFWHLLCLQVL
jgi:hypothetical protein